MPEEKQKLSQQEMLQKIYDNTEKMRKYILIRRIISVVKIVIVVFLVVLGTIYLPVFINNAFAPYKELLETTNETQGTLKGLDINSLLRNVK